MKSEPEEFSIDDLAKRKREPWTGVRNYQARNYMRDEMRVGDVVLFYHSNCAEPGVAGLAKVASVAYPDPTQFDPHSDYFDARSDRGAPRWLLVDVGYVRKLERVVALDELKANPALVGMPALRKGNRLSITPVDKAHYDEILAMEKQMAGTAAATQRGGR
jgi:predicted RNA-binding protein with PUA-like domain